MAAERKHRHLSVLVISTCVLVPFFFLSSSLKPWQGAGFVNYAQDLLYPIEYGWEASSRWVVSLWTNYVALTEAAQDNDRLRRENLLLQTRTLDYEETVLESTRLRELLGFTRRHSSTHLVAEIIGRPRLAPFHSLRIGAGRTNGLGVGMPVVSSSGIVGRLIRVGLHHSDVQLLTDPNFNIDILLQRTRVRGIVSGLGGNKCLLKLNRRAEIRIADTIVTSGIVGGFPKGLPVGKVVRISYESDNIAQKITIEPWIDFRRLEEVVVLRTEDEEIQKIIETAGEAWLESTVNRSSGG